VLGCDLIDPEPTEHRVHVVTQSASPMPTGALASPSRLVTCE
jgi:hypothetical protein